MALHVFILLSGVAAVAGVHQYYQNGTPYRNVRPVQQWWLSDIPKKELAHDPDRFTEPLPLNFTIEGSNFSLNERHSHEFRRPPSTVFVPSGKKYDLMEENRPYRLGTPIVYSTYYTPRYNDMFGGRSWLNVACMCTTTRGPALHILAGCAVITRQHVLTTASSTEYALKLLKIGYDPTFLTLWNSDLGVLYDTSAPEYTRANQANISHPVHLYDLSVWTMALELEEEAIVCMRGAPSFTRPSTPMPGEHMIVVGHQFIRAYNRIPEILAKYVVKSGDIVQPCPKLEWGWFHCMGGRWAPLGFDNGGGLYRITNRYSSGMQGLIGLGAFSMQLRSKGVVHYFTVLNTHKNLDFLYDAYMGRLTPVLLMKECENTQGAAPVMASETLAQDEYYINVTKTSYHPTWKDYRTQNWQTGRDFV